MFSLRHRRLLLSFLLTAVIITYSFSAEATIYRYVDAEGRIHFTNVPTTTDYHFYREEGHLHQLSTLINHYAKQFRLETALIKAVIKVESNFKPDVVSVKGAQGLMQLMPQTAREMGVSDPFDPTQGVFGGSFYLRKMLDSFDSNLEHALAAYNAGPSAVRKYGGIPPYKETLNYVKQVKHYLDYYRQNEDQL